MCDNLKPYYSPKTLKKKFKNMTFCLENKHLQAHESCSGISREPVCASCGSSDIVRRPTLILAQVFYSANKDAGVQWSNTSSDNEDSDSTGGETVSNEEVTPVESLR